MCANKKQYNTKVASTSSMTSRLNLTDMPTLAVTSTYPAHLYWELIVVPVLTSLSLFWPPRSQDQSRHGTGALVRAGSQSSQSGIASRRQACLTEAPRAE